MPLSTRREEEVVHLVADGLKNREIAERIKFKEHSIRNYFYQVFEKLGVSTRVELILFARRPMPPHVSSLHRGKPHPSLLRHKHHLSENRFIAVGVASTG